MGNRNLMIKGMYDTIAALSTPKGVGGIAVIRVTGDYCFQIVDKIFRGSNTIQRLHHSTALFGKIYSDKNELIDQVVVTKFVAPHSYTGENTIEISCHGGTWIVQEILNILYLMGARPADPGEFTKRAFVNGKIDLLQAESIADLINAQTKNSSRLSSNQLSGVLSEKLYLLKDELKKQCVLLEIELDFAEENLAFTDREQISQNVDNLLTEIKKLLNSFKYGKIVREGVNTVIVGKPNVGKSSILNKLLEEDRAIVSEMPGTTRDSLEELLDIEGSLFRITDTAGLRDTSDVVEKAGVERTEKLLLYAELVLFIVDSSQIIDFEIVDKFKKLKQTQTDMIVVLNKSDIELHDNDYGVFSSAPLVKISALTGDGIQNLENLMLNIVFYSKVELSDGVITKLRHLDVLNKTYDFLLNAKESIRQQMPSEFIASDLKGALDSIGELTGQVTSEQILNDIFSGFCIGK